jgi:phospholipase/carboxylesterase
VTEESLGFVHRFVPAQTADAPTLLLLHGTGGNENDLLPVGGMLDERAALLSPRGKVLEHGMPRFFRRLAEGVFDELAGFVERSVDEYDINQRCLFAVGFSNGANIAASLLLAYPRLLAGAVLLRAMVPFEPDSALDLSGIPVYLAAGRSDQMVPPENTERLAQVLREAGADVTLDWQPGGHGIGPDDIQAAQNWFAKRTLG